MVSGSSGNEDSNMRI
jgi:hypothetical protein